MSVPSRNRKSTLLPAYGSRLTVTWTKLLPFGLPVQALRPDNGLPKDAEIVPLYPPEVMLAPASAQLVPPLVETSSTPPSYPFSKENLCQKLSVASAALAGMLNELLSVNCWSETLLSRGRMLNRCRNGPICRHVPTAAARHACRHHRDEGAERAALKAFAEVLRAGKRSHRGRAGVRSGGGSCLPVTRSYGTRCARESSILHGPYSRKLGPASPLRSTSLLAY